MKKKFREGRQAEAIADCEALCLREPTNLQAKRLCATMHAMVRNYARSRDLLLQVRNPAQEDPEILFNLGLCEKELKNFEDAGSYFKTFTEKFPEAPDGWAGLAECQLQLGEFAASIRSAGEALQRDASLVPALAARADAFQALGRVAEAAADYQAALALAPADDETLKKATLSLLEAGQGQEALALCRGILQAQPDNLVARRGAEWVLSQLVPLWHVPMMNEPERNQAFDDGLAALVTPDKLVFEIGAGSGLLAMMAARHGARQVVTCEAVGLVAETARKIVRRNGYESQVTVLARPSQAVEVGDGLPAQADILVHEIFSSELLGEHVLPAIEDAKRRLLKPGGAVLPASASIMVALVGGEALGKNLHVGEASGFDLCEFNAIHPKKRPLYREDLAPLLLSADIEAFRFDFQNDSAFPAQRKLLDIRAAQAGRCWGLIQWVRIDFGPGIRFENHPSRPRLVSNWQHTIHGFDEPLQLREGQAVKVSAMHDRSRPWFQRAG